MFVGIQCVVLILAPVYEIYAYRYLVVSPIPGKSHAILAGAMIEHLAKNGHEVTYITAIVPENLPSQVTVIETKENDQYFSADQDMKIKEIMDNAAYTADFLAISSIMMDISRSTVENPNVQRLIKDNTQKFDAVIAEWMFNEVYAGFAAVFNCPLIWFSSVEPHWVILQLVDELPNPAYTTTMLSDSTLPLTFKQRIIELSLQVLEKFYRTFWRSFIERNIYNKYFVPAIQNRQNTVPSFETLRYKASLIVSNSHISTANAAKLPPNVIGIGGYHINPKVKPLSEDLQQIMDNATDGVIYFSMGSNLRSKSFPDSVTQNLLTMFRKFKQTVIWKFEKQLPNIPSNVHIVQWAPQQSVLAHKNCVLFITHGGLLSIIEAIHFEVPIIGIPVYGDQYINVARAVKKGFALRVDLTYILASDLEIAISKMVNNSSYTSRVQELSQIYHDRPVPPAKELVHWVEHVVKTKGAAHLRSPAFMVPWYQKLYIDLILVITGFVLVIKYLLKFVSCFIFKIREQKLIKKNI